MNRQGHVDFGAPSGGITTSDIHRGLGMHRKTCQRGEERPMRDKGEAAREGKSADKSQNITMLANTGSRGGSFTTKLRLIHFQNQ